MQLFGKVALGITDEKFDRPFEEIKRRAGVAGAELEAVIARIKEANPGLTREILAGSVDGKAVLCQFETEVAPGTKVR